MIEISFSACYNDSREENHTSAGDAVLLRL